MLALAWGTCMAQIFDFRPQSGSLSETDGVAVVGDVNHDGWPEPLGSFNVRGGVLRSRNLAAFGVDVMEGVAIGEAPLNDARLADFNGDNFPDLISEPYASAADTMQARLYLNDGTGRFHEDLKFKTREYRGRGEGVVVADFNNDGAVDVFLPFYTYSCADLNYVDTSCPNAPQAYLLLNDGHGNFTEAADQAGVSMRASTSPSGNGLQPEGAQAVDIDDNGFIDLIVAGKVFLNQGLQGRTLTSSEDRSLDIPQFAICDCGISAPTNDDRADEGTKVLDWNNDGRLDLLLHNWNRGPILIENKGSTPLFGSNRNADTEPLRLRFAARRFVNADKTPLFSADPNLPVRFQDSFGMNIYDLDNDGLEDIYISSSTRKPRKPCTPSTTTVCPRYTNVLFHNIGTGFKLWEDSQLLGGNRVGNVAFGDINRDGRMDVIYPGTYKYYQNFGGSRRAFTVEVVGANGEQNQFGRVVRVKLPKPGCDLGVRSCTLTRTVDSGSGYHSQSQYPLLIGTAFRGVHWLSVLVPYQDSLVEVRAKVLPTQSATVYAPSSAYPQGRVVIRKNLGR
jgi:hypothetical protein